ncbi:dihydrolipoyl dehydrogenase [Virgibacillus profundi]|uniref:Dihydrolipoyl dehydrogenase n=1 Tax=Virgibacillus profundi TaxID=2024555 RepID=A0A2A2ICM6_9BACI|nr:dihydrolipoyl dehydrogenase [Virgibacillus profundi]PAV28895.1 dihydrolipoyl dehydrogenase [Virgibacillus profundi]PXY53063.1 dihydrolipoyl dehydrogenase [Virgibacillus profundi]
MVVGEISQERDLVIIGGGPGGYSAAIRAAQLGIQVTLIEQGNLGGVCLNKGCIPSKIWTYAAKKRSEIQHMEELGIESSGEGFHVGKLLDYQTKVTKQLRMGVEKLCSENQVEVIKGKATFTRSDRIGVENGHQFDTYTFKQAIIATGSFAELQANIPRESNRILLSDEIFKLAKIPDHLIVYGNDYIAFEIASTYREFGSKVTLLLENERDFPYDSAINKELTRQFKKKKIQIIKNAQLNSVKEMNDSIITITYEKDDDTEHLLEGTHLFTPGIRKPNVQSLGINRLGVKQNEEGFITVNKNLQTTIPSIYAIGDVVKGPMLAVKAIKQGKVTAELIAGGKPEVDLTFLPAVAHTIPPIASVGLTEEEAVEHDLDIRISQFPFGSNGYAMISGKKDGFIKVISDKSNDIILGIHMIGEGAIELSASFAQLLEMAAKEEDVKFPLYAHPSMNEGLLEAVEGLIGESIHMVPKRKDERVSHVFT